ncbi:MAG: hypothetical protein AAF368_02240 [Planctomycetota bacterium]
MSQFGCLSVQCHGERLLTSVLLCFEIALRRFSRLVLNAGDASFEAFCELGRLRRQLGLASRPLLFDSALSGISRFLRLIDALLKFLRELFLQRRQRSLALSPILFELCLDLSVLVAEIARSVSRFLKLSSRAAERSLEPVNFLVRSFGRFVEFYRFFGRA